VTNVTNFGAFVDIGVHQDGLVHVSALADKFVKDPREVVKAGDVVRVKVVEVDLARKRIALTLRMGDAADKRPAERATSPQPQRGRPQAKPKEQAKAGGALADALARAMGRG